ncbi:hypothetical protein AMC78_CH01093 [Rhizobium phaseoli]|uniref:hypothetical protein n=1 Tax=Rhizobium phaseoli TaxID=396 RepID=UPI0007F05EE8|nr:hypothetical protein [Rhizobium phaseoli]ANM03230.1 hypothetical protein AMC78_CH01093 [Rhizobium phaseoli]
MPSLAQMTGSLHIHNFYIEKLKAKQEQLFESDLTWRCFSTTWLPFGQSTPKYWLTILPTWNATIDGG